MAATPISDMPGPAAADRWRRTIAQASDAEARRLLLDVVRTSIGRELAEDVRHFDPAAHWRHFNVKGPVAERIRIRIIEQTGLRLPETVFFDYPTPDSLCERLCNDLRPDRGPNPKLEDLGRDSDGYEPIAIVGMACRLPGGVDSAEALWDLVISGTDAITSFPENRGWDRRQLDNPDLEAPGSSSARYGGFLDDIAGFDAEFFGISPREATAMHPEQRILLEIAWEALEHARIDPRSMRQRQVGVFTGTLSPQYGPPWHEAARNVKGLTTTGTTSSVISGRIAYALGLRGPAITIDTACSGSLVAIHLACQALRSGDCDLALAGGVTITTTPGMFTEFARHDALAPDGRCKSFADTADGTSWSEGAGLVVLERLPDAQRAGHRVLSVIRGSAVNQDGASNGLTAPNGSAQKDVITKTLARAGIDAADVDVVEAHGTGTRLGDPIEANALLATYGNAHSSDRPLWLGSLKSNLGHTQAAAGVAAVIKMTMAFRHNVLPRTLHVEKPTTKVDWSSGAIRLLTEARPWPDGACPRNAAVSSFGISGTNAHLVLQQPPESCEPPEGAEPIGRADPFALLFPISGRTQQSLFARAGQLHEKLARHPELDLYDIAYSLAVTRTHFSNRAVPSFSNLRSREQLRTELLDVLRALQTGNPHPRLTTATVDPAGVGGIVFVLPGQGSQYPGMAASLYRHSSVFAQALDTVCAALEPFLDIPLQQVLFTDPDEGGPNARLLDQTQFAQPALFAFGVAMHAVFVSVGLTPDFLLGHSLGELTAAHLAGVWSLEDAARLVAARGRLMQACRAEGTMLAIGTGEHQVLAMLEQYPQLEVAAVNSGSSTVVSGERDVIEQFRAKLAAQGIRTRGLRVSHANHSVHMEPALAPFHDIAAELDYHEPAVPTLSNVTGGFARAADITGPDYWATHLRRTVRFADNVTALLDRSPHTFIELSPQPVLTPAIAEILSVEASAAKSRSGSSLAVAALRADNDDLDSIASTLARLHCHGHDLDWRALNPGAQHADLPTFPFQHTDYWLAPTSGSDTGSAGSDRLDHPWLSAALELPYDGGWVFTGQIARDTHPWLADHTIGAVVLLPGTAFIEMALHAGEHCGFLEVDELILQAPLSVPDHAVIDLRVTVGSLGDTGSRPVSIHSRSDGEWRLHATATLLPGHTATSVPTSAECWPPAEGRPVDVGDLYDRLASRSYFYGPAFQAVQRIWLSTTGIVYAEIVMPEGVDATGFALHPALLDAALHPALGAGEDNHAGRDAPGIRLPFSVSGITLHTTAATSLRVQLTPLGSNAIAVHASDPAGRPVITIANLTTRPAPLDGLRTLAGNGRDTTDKAMLEVTWVTHSTTGATELPRRRWAVLTSTAEPVPAALHDLPTHGDLGKLIADDTTPAVVIWPAPTAPTTTDDTANLAASTNRRIHELAAQTLAILRAWVTHPETAGSHVLLVRTHHAVSVGPSDRAPDPGHAAVWGMVRTCQTEHPDHRIVLLDTDNDTRPGLSAIAASPSPDNQFAIRGDTAYIPRLIRASTRRTTADAPMAIAPDGTVLVTGGTGTLASLLAEHLVRHHDVRYLLLVSRRGPEAPGTDILTERLTELGAHVTVRACDISDPLALRELLTSVPAAHPLTAVVHTAAVLADAPITTLTNEQLDRVLTAKSDTAWHLHEMTQHLNLSTFVLFSSVAGILGTPAQANYAAANAALDALAEYRHRRGLPATSIGWGYWDVPTGITSHLSDRDRIRITSTGLTPISAGTGSTLFDRAMASAAPAVIAAPTDTHTLDRRARDNALPMILTALSDSPPRRPAVTTAAPLATAEHLAELSPDRQRQWLLDLVRSATATVLAQPDTSRVDPAASFRDLGIDSLTALELRNDLARTTGLPLDPTVIFDHPTPAAMVDYVLSALAPRVAPDVESVDDKIEQIEKTLESPETAEEIRSETLRKLRIILDKNAAFDSADSDEQIAEIFESSTTEALFDYLDRNLDPDQQDR